MRDHLLKVVVYAQFLQRRDGMTARQGGTDLAAPCQLHEQRRRITHDAIEDDDILSVRGTESIEIVEQRCDPPELRPEYLRTSPHEPDRVCAVQEGSVQCISFLHGLVRRRP